MFTEFVGMQCSREELLEIHQALLTRTLLLDTLQQANGEIVDHKHELLHRIEALLGKDEETLHEQDHATEDEMWQYAWLAFTDEWAWHRALQTVQEQTGERFTTLSDSERGHLVEADLAKNIEKYLAEIDMREIQVKQKVKYQSPSSPAKT